MGVLVIIYRLYSCLFCLLDISRAARFILHSVGAHSPARLLLIARIVLMVVIVVNSNRNKSTTCKNDIPCTAPEADVLATGFTAREIGPQAQHRV